MLKKSEMRKHGLVLFAGDVAVITVVMFSTAFFQFSELSDAAARFSSNRHFDVNVNPPTLALAMYLLWIFAEVVNRSWNPHLAGTGIAEYLMLSKSVLAVLFVLAFGALLFKIDVSRRFVFTSLAAGLIALITYRWVARQWLLRQRGSGSYARNTLVLGPATNALEFIEKMSRDKNSGFRPVKLMVFKDNVPEKIVDRLNELGVSLEIFSQCEVEKLAAENVETVIIFNAGDVSPKIIREISWALEGTPIELIVSSGLVDFAGSRLTTQVVAGAQFLFVETPKFEGFKFLAKSVMDFIFSVAALVLISPVMIIAALAIWLEDRGPVFYAQERVGQNGKHFKMFKFRSMIVDADKLHAQLRAKLVDPVNNRMYKDPNDPRLTKVGRFIRRYSIDELPQIFNVFNGTMSIVGPRPPLASEVAEYEKHEMRRLLVRPGITGLWQVSGRSLLSWEETVRLDLYYVENWTVMTDILIVIRTAKAVFDRTGAY